MEVWKVTGRMDIHGSMEGDWEDGYTWKYGRRLGGWIYMEVWKVIGRMDIHGSMEGDWEDGYTWKYGR